MEHPNLDSFLEEMASSRTKDSDKNMLEELAALEHDQWVHWAKDILETEEIDFGRVKKWKRLFGPYKSLSEDKKELDREWARKVLAIIKKNKG